VIKAILVVIAVVAVVFVVVVAMRPAEYRVERSASVNAAPAVVFAEVNDLHKWQEFSPWAKLDPAAKNTYDGPPAGTGAVFTWAGNAKVGEGRMTITESRPSELIRIKLEFMKPFTSTANAKFTFEPKGNQTLVTWSMSGKNNFVAKAFGLFMDMDKMIGGQFEEGLANLKSLSESAARS
jgi:carbon monoxide dehydrogenase subunit G